MKIERILAHPLQLLSYWVISTRHYIQEWVRKEIIDDDPYEFELCWDGEILIVESENIVEITDFADFDLNEFLQYLIAERGSAFSSGVKDRIPRHHVNVSTTLAAILKEKVSHTKHTFCAQVDLYDSEDILQLSDLQRCTHQCI